MLNLKNKCFVNLTIRKGGETFPNNLEIFNFQKEFFKKQRKFSKKTKKIKSSAKFHVKVQKFRNFFKMQKYPKIFGTKQREITKKTKTKKQLKTKFSRQILREKSQNFGKCFEKYVLQIS